MSYIISANYRDRSSPDKWLVRKQDEPVEKAKAYKKVLAQDVKFETSSAIEQGFGCQIVAIASSVKLQRVPAKVDKSRRLKFSGMFFYDSQSSTRLHEVSTLLLTSDMRYLP